MRQHKNDHFGHFTHKNLPKLDRFFDDQKTDLKTLRVVAGFGLTMESKTAQNVSI